MGTSPTFVQKKLIACIWVFKVKNNVDGIVNRYKARLLAKGYAHLIHNIDYKETFVSMLKITIVYTVLVLATIKGWHVDLTDVKNAFLQGQLLEEVYMVQPHGFKSKTNPNEIC